MIVDNSIIGTFDYQLSNADRLSTDAYWIFRCSQPILTKLSIAHQIDCIYKFSFLHDCNDTLAMMYGYSSYKDMIGMPIELTFPSNKENIDFLSAFIENNYEIENAESKEIDKNGRPLFFINTMRGIVNHELIIGAFGYQKFRY